MCLKHLQVTPWRRLVTGIQLALLVLCPSPAAASTGPGRLAAASDPTQTSSECERANSHPEWVWCHDFEAADAADIDKYWNDTYGVPERVYLIGDNPGGIPGGRSMRMQVVNSTERPLDHGVSSGPKKFLGANVDWQELYYRRYVRFNADFQQGNFMHLGGLGACHPDLYPWQCMGQAGRRPQGDDRFSSNLEPWSAYQTLPWPGRWGFYSYYYRMHMDCGHPGPDDCYGDMFAPESDVFVPRGEWAVLEMMIDPGTPNRADGSQTFWIDGRRVFSATGMAWRTTDELRINKVGAYLYIHNNPAYTTNILDMDNVIVSREYIGPATCADSQAVEAPCACGGSPEPHSESHIVSSGYCCSGVWQELPCGSTAAAARLYLPLLLVGSPG